MTCTWLYVLTDGSEYYVGITYHLGKRMWQHRRNRGSVHTVDRDFEFVTAYKILDYEKHDYELENMLTLQMAQLCGSHAVIGGKYCKSTHKLHDDASEKQTFNVCDCGLPVDMIHSDSGYWYQRCSKNSVKFMNECEWYDGWQIEPCKFLQRCRFEDAKHCVTTRRRYENWMQKRQQESQTTIAFAGMIELD